MNGMIGLKPVSALPETKPDRRAQIRIKGAVQGVGFRPFVYGLAKSFGLSGWVLNDGEGVLIEVQGKNIDDFCNSLTDQAPVLSRIDDINVLSIPSLDGETDFEIRQSDQTDIITDIIPDAATCPACLKEMYDPDNPRYGYPFINCTHCGPRYTITHTLPYDRPQTSMNVFEMCDSCSKEYHNPLDRRFHAQPICCPDCGPQLSMSVDEMAERILDGQILAIKGLGGFHLVCNAHDEDAIQRLRDRKNREAKPFAIMVARTESIKHFAKLNIHEKELLESVERPIVLLEKHGSEMPDNIAPGLNRMGVMLPYTPIHHLLLNALNRNPLVMTSANPGGEPLVISNEEAYERLDGIADAIITHDRDILIRVDDSVLRSDMGQTTFMRRARGFTPKPIFLRDKGPSVLALGAYLKNTICLTRDNQAYLSQHIGDLDNVATIGFLKETVSHLKNILRVDPAMVIHDLHPDFASTHFANELGLPTLSVQHHHAHIASVIAEHQLNNPVIGVALDGFGLGEEGDSWGGELLKVDGLSCERLGHLHQLAQPGGDKAAIQPWRMGASVLHQLGRSDEIETRYQTQDTKTLTLMLDKGLNAPMTSSAGRLFDAACGLLGVCTESKFEGQAPMMLESMVSRIEIMEQGWSIENGQLNFLPLLNAISGLTAEHGANLFHGTLIAGLADWIKQACQEHDIKTAALSGGCFLNQILAQGLTRKLQQGGITPYLNQQAPLSDAGLSLGQAWLGQQKLAAEN